MQGLIAHGLLKPTQIIGYDIRADRLRSLSENLGIRTAGSVAELLAQADAVILAVKPQHMADVFRSVSGNVRSQTLYVSIAAGISIARLEAGLGKGVPVIRVMPNTPALVGRGVSVLSRGTHATDNDVALVRTLFAAVGETFVVEEPLLDAVTGLSGSGPGYLALVVEALADGGVAAGLPRDIALRLAAETMRGTGELLCQAIGRGEHPAVVRERVTSPAGTTAAGLQVLERAAVRAAFAEAVVSAAERARVLGEE